jgi:4-diphosphocytidyl-2-C-methyl-D-erythritol kinase
MSEAPNTRRVAAAAKINPFLRVLGRRQDGYHEVETVLLPISMADGMEIHAASDPGQFRTLSLSLEVSGETDLVQGVPLDESNLALIAAKALADDAGVRGFADIFLEKRVPAAAGLGGGSADAAATLSALNQLWGIGMSDAELSAVGAKVGSEVPGMLLGAALVRGRGDDVASVEGSAFRWALVTFDFGVSTRDAYGWWDEDEAGTGPEVEPLLSVLNGSLEDLARVLFNDLEGPVIRRHPRIADAKEALLAGGAVGAVMSGSGPTLAGLLANDQPLAAQTQHELERISGRPVADVASTAG